MASLYILFETASGFALFKRKRKKDERKKIDFLLFLTDVAQSTAAI
jgi:hypothetical protein